MVNDWLETTLGEVILTNHQSYSKNDNWSFINYLDTGNITENNISDVQYLEVGIDKIPSRAKRKVDSGDIIYSTVRPNQKHFGVIRNPLDNMLVSTGFTTIRCKSAEADTNFIYWFLVQPQIIEHLQSIGEQSASAYPSIKPSDIESLDIQLPPIEEQKAIAHILGSLDDRIELNRQMNETLEAMAQALFKSWFVDFDPVIDNALVSGKPIPDEFIERAEQRKAIEKKDNSDIQSLFPDEFEFTEEMGWIPKGWEVSKLGEYIEVKRGGSPRPIHDYLVPKGLPWVKISDATASNSRFLVETKQFIKPEGLNKTTLLKKGSLILSNSATPGLPKFLDLDACIHDGWLHFPKKKIFTDNYLYQLFLVVRQELLMQGNGSVFTNLKTDILKNHMVVVPNIDVLNYFDNWINSFHNKIHAVQIDVDNLSRIRDTLLPKLMSGELRIPDAARLVDEII
ncbi:MULTISPECIES: restriction endonuclease subunit S [Psychrobacter]|uniref:restriction endonuclease subunit S n=1 Tax=Psychrobacter TaxID=497 RepID=UPI003FB921D1